MIDRRCAFNLKHGRDVITARATVFRLDLLPELRVDRDQRLEERRRNQRREACGGRRRLQVAHVRLEGGALRVSEGPVGSADLKLLQSTPQISYKQHTSMGSPSAVPVPCASSAGTPVSFERARRTVSISRPYDEPFGAVRLALGPSCCTADPSTTAS